MTLLSLIHVRHQVTFPDSKQAFRGWYYDTHVEKTRLFLVSPGGRTLPSHDAKSWEWSAAAGLLWEMATRSSITVNASLGLFSWCAWKSMAIYNNVWLGFTAHTMPVHLPASMPTVYVWNDMHRCIQAKQRSEEFRELKLHANLHWTFLFTEMQLCL